MGRGKGWPNNNPGEKKKTNVVSHRRGEKGDTQSKQNWENGKGPDGVPKKEWYPTWGEKAFTKSRRTTFNCLVRNEDQEKDTHFHTLSIGSRRKTGRLRIRKKGRKPKNPGFFFVEGERGVSPNPWQRGNPSRPNHRRKKARGGEI